VVKLSSCSHKAISLSDRVDSLNPCRRRGRRLIMVAVFVGCVVLIEEPNILFTHLIPTKRELLVLVPAVC